MSITGSASPASGKDLLTLPEGRGTREVRVLFSTTLLYTGGQGESYEADTVSIGGVTYEVTQAQTWLDSTDGGTVYRYLVTAL